VQPEVPSGGLPDSIKVRMKAAMAGHSGETDSEEEEEEEEEDTDDDAVAEDDNEAEAYPDDGETYEEGDGHYGGL
jgi:hypothetical protein